MNREDKTMKATLLLVDDDPTSLEILVENLGKEDFNIITATTGRKALEQSERYMPDLVLLDVMMPDLDGFETCRQLKHNKATCAIPVIFMTAMADTRAKLKGFEVGGVDYMTKPFHFDEVLVRVNTHLTIRRQQQQLEQQTEQLKELNSQKDRFISMIAHDLRSPFSTLRLLIGIAADNVEGSGQDELESIITLLKKSSENLYTLLENLLAWSRIQRGVIKYRPQGLDFRNIAFQNITLLAPYAEQKQISIASNIEDEIAVYADYHMIDAVVRNLLSNALKFTYPGGQIKIWAQPAADWVTVAVADTGTGIESEDIPKLFRLDTSYRRKGTAREQGTGLGLLLCKEFVETHQGNIWVESEAGKGSTFKFTLPALSEEHTL